VEATPRIELGMEVLQTSALPLGYVAGRLEPIPILAAHIGHSDLRPGALRPVSTAGLAAG
jgi:hypothetical protein